MLTSSAPRGGTVSSFPRAAVGGDSSRRLCDETRENRRLESPPTKDHSRGGWRAAILPLVVVAAAAVLQMAGVRVPVVGRGWARFDPARWPVELLPKLSEIDRSAAEGTPIFNDLNFGGFLIYHAPRLRVFVDDRCSLYGADFLQAYDRARREEPAQIDRWQRQYGFAYALVETGGEFDRYLSAAMAWTPLGRTPAATLYERRMGVPPSIR